MRNLRLICCAILGGALATAGCQTEPQKEPQSNEQANATSPLNRLPVAEAPLDRAALLVAAAKAASAAALGQDDGAEQRQLDGKRFEVRIRFGCPPAPAEPSESDRFRVLFNEENRTLRVRAAPDLSKNDPLIAHVASEAVEAVEGFWLRRPWLLTDGCPAQAEAAPATEPDEANEKAAEKEAAKGPAQPEQAPSPAEFQRVGLAEFFTQTDSRIGRRSDRAYEATEVLAEGTAPSPVGYSLVLSGRLRQLPQGRVITCRATSPDVPPQCVIAAQFDRVWIQNPTSGRVLAEWSR